MLTGQERTRTMGRKVKAGDLTAAFRVYIPPGARLSTTANPDGTFTVRMPVASYYYTRLDSGPRRLKFIADLTGLLARRVEGTRVQSITYRIGRKSILGQAVFATVTVA
jgi:hypothetical protein